MRLAQQLPVPVQGIKRHGLTDTWGASRSSGRTHEGIDILAPRGTKVFSATEGLVADLRNNNLGGKVIWVLGPSGSWHYYAHLNEHKRGLSVGDFVKKGDLIDFSTNWGHFSYRVTDRQVLTSDESVDVSVVDKEKLILFCTYPQSPFGNLADQRLYVFCEKASGPAVEVSTDD
jgi:hypothetical protein